MPGAVNRRNRQGISHCLESGHLAYLFSNNQPNDLLERLIFTPVK